MLSPIKLASTPRRSGEDKGTDASWLARPFHVKDKAHSDLYEKHLCDLPYMTFHTYMQIAKPGGTGHKVLK